MANAEKLLIEKPWLKSMMPLLSTGTYTFQELYDFNPFTDADTSKGLAITEPGQLNGLTEMYKASLMLKAQVQLLVRLDEKNHLSLW